MPTVIPFIPEQITVHLGPPESSAENVTVSFSDYIKNVVSSEIYPTWEPDALRANALAIISFALNRIYTEYYRSRNYDFDITSSTGIDQKFINGRNIYENISVLVDDLYTDYLRRPGFAEPLAAKFCNGVTVTCDGLSQWGSQYLAQDGLDWFSILQSYYGENLELVEDAPVQSLADSYPGAPLERGSLGVNVVVIQTSLNRISQNYPAIPKVTTDGIYGPATEDAVKAFQSIFSLAPDGIVGRATWHRLAQLYVAVERLGELQSEGQVFFGFAWEYPDRLAPGDTGAKITHLQYMLSVNSQFIREIPAVPLTGVFDEATDLAVEAFQNYVNLPVTGIVDRATWEAIYAQFSGIEGTVFGDQTLFPILTPPRPAQSVSALQHELQAVSVFAPDLPVPAASGKMDSRTQSALSALQKRHGLPTAPRVTQESRHALGHELSALTYGMTTTFFQYPGHMLTAGMRDEEVSL